MTVIFFQLSFITRILMILFHSNYSLIKNLEDKKRVYVTLPLLQSCYQKLVSSLAKPSFLQLALLIRQRSASQLAWQHTETMLFPFRSDISIL